ncbi:MAG: polyprenyl synthetase family protein [Pseudomonadota bacterium]
MDLSPRIEKALEAAVSKAGGAPCPPKLATCLRYAVFPGGARVRPRLSLAVAQACGDRFPRLADAAAASIELLHCASLIHDDLPCFDDADIRRGKPALHKQFGEPLAVLTGDALIVLAFETLGRQALDAPDRLGSLIGVVSQAVGGPSGICAGQAWECEPSAPLEEYHRAKTGSLFAAATVAGALAAGAEPAGWRRLGECLGEAFQVADDICDHVADPDILGKPANQDVANGRPNAVLQLGLEGAGQSLQALLDEAIESIPDCEGAQQLRTVIAIQSKPFMPKGFAQHAA